MMCSDNCHPNLTHDQMRSIVVVCMFTLLMEGCDTPKSSHCSAVAFFADAKYLRVVITCISGVIELLCGERCERITNEIDHKHYLCII